MKQRTTRSKNVPNEKWLTYPGMAAAFLAATSDADGQIVYTDVNPDSVLVSASFDIDFDGDGNVDITIGHTIPSSSTQIASVNVPAGAAVLGSLASSFLYPDVVPNGALIDPADPAWQTQSFGSLFYAAGSGGYGQWNGQSGYLGVRFHDTGGANHYAWVELQVALNATQATVRGYAYQAIADSSIIAGDIGSITGITGPRAAALVMDLFPNPVTDHMTVNLSPAAQGSVEVRILDAIGQVLFTRQEGMGSAAREIPLDLHTLSAGTYFVELRNGDRVVHRKFVKKGN